MKTTGEIYQKLKQVKFRHLKRELEKLLEKRSVNCRFNYFLKTKNKGNAVLELLQGGVYVCKCPDLESHICDFRLGEEEPATSCAFFSLRHTKEEIKKSLKDFFTDRDYSEIAVRFPDVAALLWVAGEDIQLEGLDDELS